MMARQKRDYLWSKKGHQTIVLMVEITFTYRARTFFGEHKQFYFTSSHVTCLKVTDL